MTPDVHIEETVEATADSVLPAEPALPMDSVPPVQPVLSVLPSPIGPITIAATEIGIVSCSFLDPVTVGNRLSAAGVDTAGAAAARWRARAGQELADYFAGTTRELRVPTDLRLVSPFDRDVLAALTDVGYGATTSYGRLGTALGLPTAAVRGVGQALGRNPVLILVPCHRVVGADGALTGYAGGLPAKRWLLDLESDLPRLALDF